MSVDLPDDENTGAGIVPVWIIRDPAISGPAKLVYLVLSIHSEASERELLAMTGLRRPNYRAGVDELMRLGVLAYFADGDKVTCSISLYLPEGSDA